VGKLADTNLIKDIIVSMLYDTKDLIGKKVLVTAGPTVSDIDPVRFISNNSTGKMGFAIAEEARDRGAEVTLISGPVKLDVPYGIDFSAVRTNEEMLNAVLSKFDDMDIVIKAAAVADYKIKDYSNQKIKKSSAEVSFNFIKDNDILKKLGEIKKHQILVGFAAESNNLIENAQIKLKNKNLDYIVANDITSKDTGFASNDNRVIILSKDGCSTELDKMSKRQVARRLFNLINEKR
ncbi:MAG: bifunctional phosphopantothenoylcysteine decarboxylase/phosphopantothenate--cysteine ligase CoaBC, partial [Bacillota bacterium]|nr:bifunctional phosphopantothenoylcysteine decarboxylase/phosphopantothenate--cysteine ligase CoaBC [Bacillota bacterium]